MFREQYVGFNQEREEQASEVVFRVNVGEGKQKWDMESLKQMRQKQRDMFNYYL